MSNILFLLIVNILSVNPSLDYQVDLGASEHKYGEKYEFNNFFRPYVTTTYYRTNPKHDALFWNMSKNNIEVITKDYSYYRAYDHSHLSDNKKEELINEIDKLLAVCVDKTNYPSRLYLTNNYKNDDRYKYNKYKYKKSDPRFLDRMEYSNLYKIINELLYKYKAYTFTDIISIRNDFSFFLKNPTLYLKLKKRIKTTDLYEKCYMYASGYPYGTALSIYPWRGKLENIDEVRKLAEKVYLLAYKNHMVSYIMSTDSSFASVPYFLLEKYMVEENYIDLEKVNPRGYIEMQMDEDFLKFIFNHLNSLVI